MNDIEVQEIKVSYELFTYDRFKSQLTTEYKYKQIIDEMTPMAVALFNSYYNGIIPAGFLKDGLMSLSKELCNLAYVGRNRSIATRLSLYIVLYLYENSNDFVKEKGEENGKSKL